LLARQAWNPETDELDLARLYPALQTYCPIVHDLSPQQALFLLLDCREGFYGGAAGGGKTWALLAAALQYVDVPGYAALLLRRTFPQLSQPGQLIATSKEWLGPTDAVWNEQQKEWRFPSGAVLKFGHVKDENAVFNYQGGAYHYIGWDELTQFTPSQFEYVSFSRQRRDLRMQELGVPIRVRAAANPGGIGHAWVKKRFLDQRSPSTVFIPAKAADNPGLDVADYIENSLSHLGDILRRQLLDGDWGAFEGAAFHKFDPAVHVVPRFELPSSWERFESVDPGINNPTAWLAWAVDHEGNLLVFDSVYTDEGEGLPSKVAPRVLARRELWASTVAHTDPSAWNRSGGLNRWGLPASLATEYEDAGVQLSPANNDPRAGYARLRELLEPDPRRLYPDWHPRAREPGAPRLFIIGETCPELVEQLPAAPLQPIEKRLAGEIIDPDWESAYGHAVASARYGAMSRPDASDLPAGPPPEPRTVAGVEENRRRVSDRSRYQY